MRKNITFKFDESFKPHAKQLRFYEAGNYHNQRFALWGNRTGKTFGVGREIFYHASGMYPKDWNGYRFSRPVRVMCATENIDLCQKNLVSVLFKGSSASENPAIPDIFVTREEPSPCKIHTRYIHHVSGGESVIFFMSYRSGSKAMQGFQSDIVWLDERASFEIYNECMMRLTSFDGERTHMLVTTWPEGGYTDIVDYFYKGTEQDYIQELDEVRELSKNPRIEKPNPYIYYSHASWDDNPYMADGEKQILEASTPPHLLEARRSGIPFFGSGNVFYMPQNSYTCGFVELKDHYRYILGVDPAVTENGSWGAVLLAIDENNIARTVRNYQATGITKSQHAVNLESMLPFAGCPIVIDPAGGGEDQRTQQGMADFLRNECGLNVSVAEKGKGSVELGINLLCEKLLNSTLQVMYNESDHTGCSILIDQMRRYARDDKGLIIKKNDHVIDAMRYAIWHLDLARQQMDLANKGQSFYDYRSGFGVGGR